MIPGTSTDSTEACSARAPPPAHLDEDQPDKIRVYVCHARESSEEARNCVCKDILRRRDGIDSHE